MTFPAPQKLQHPVEPYNVSGHHFSKIIRRWWVLWATHLGDDIVVSPNTPVKAIGDGKVIWSEMRPGDELNRNWGGLIIIAHQCSFNPRERDNKVFYSLYGHMKGLKVKKDEPVKTGQPIGMIAESYTPENGWWKIPHLHFGIYTGPWENKVLPGYNRVEERRTKTKWWRDPGNFISSYNKQEL